MDIRQRLGEIAQSRFGLPAARCDDGQLYRALLQLTRELSERRPAPAGYIGSRPLCAPESRALAAFTLAVRPHRTLSWHTKGEVVYWRFHQPPVRAARDRRLARALSEITGYPLAEAYGSAGGYKDWCVEKLKIPAFTVEAGEETLSHPLRLAELPALLRRCGEAVYRFSEVT